MEYLTFKKFATAEEANDLGNLLTKNGFKFILVEDAPSVDFTFSNHGFDREYLIKLRSEDFEKANELLRSEVEEISVSDIPSDYYLLEFTNEELMEILMKPDEWSELDVRLSQLLLQQRGKTVNDEFIEELREARIKEMARPEKRQKGWIGAGYIISIIGGFLGLFIGWHLVTFKKTLPNGERVYSYSNSDRQSGKYILVIGGIFGVIHLTLWYINKFN